MFVTFINLYCQCHFYIRVLIAYIITSLVDSYHIVLLVGCLIYYLVFVELFSVTFVLSTIIFFSWFASVL